jgi:hypothetical protein
LITACFTAVIATHFALCLLPVFSRAPIRAAFLSPDLQGAQPDPFFPDPFFPLFPDPFLPVWRHGFLCAGDAGQGFIALIVALTCRMSMLSWTSRSKTSELLLCLLSALLLSLRNCSMLSMTVTPFSST